jgi:hypothetical protein
VRELRFHLDEDAEAHALVRALRDRGVDVTTTSEIRLNKSTDETLLIRATAGFSSPTTPPISVRFTPTSCARAVTNSGIVIAEQQRIAVGEMMRRILRLRAALDATAMRDRLEFLSRW